MWRGRFAHLSAENLRFGGGETGRLQPPRPLPSHRTSETHIHGALAMTNHNHFKRFLDHRKLELYRMPKQ